MKSSLLSFTALSLGCASLSGALTFQEYFNPADFGANDSNLAVGTNWDGGTNQLRFNTVNLSFTNANYGLTGNAGTGSARTNASEVSGRGSWTTVSATALSGEFWFSALHQRNVVSATNSYSIFNLGAANALAPTDASFNNSTSFGLYNDGTSLHPFIATGNASSWAAPTTGSASADTPLLFVARGNTTSNSLDIWIYESSDLIPLNSVDLGTPTITTSSALLGDITRLWIGKRGATGGTTYFDALRLSTSSGNTGYQDVMAIPEPSTYAALLGLLALGAVAFRRRK